MKILNIIYDKEIEITKHASDVWLCNVYAADENVARPFLDWFKKLDRILLNAGIDQSIDVAIVDGCQSSNGHALIIGGRPTAWISASNYPSDESIKVFGTHEIVHAIHYGYVNDYYFDGIAEKNHVGRQLVTEGVATYVTEKLLNLSESEALWSDYLKTDVLNELMVRYQDQQSGSASRILQDWDSTNAEYFYASDANDVDCYRSGYFIGRHIIEKIVRENNLPLVELLTMKRSELDYFAIKQLECLQEFLD